MRELFIYFRARAEHEQSVLDSVRAIQRQLRLRRPGLSARLMRRPETREGLQTWMEVYAFPQGGGVDDGLEALIMQAAAELSPFVVGQRHTETFIPCED